jgi:hypothetical protein
MTCREQLQTSSSKPNQPGAHWYCSPFSSLRISLTQACQWMLHSQDSLHSGPANPVTLAASEITALLPCSEEDFAAGRQPTSRAALEGTPPAIECPSLTKDTRRSLFASLMQIHHYWGIVGRRAVKFGRSPRPWEKSSDFSRMVSKLEDWEDSLPARHKWSIDNLRYHKARGEDLVRLILRWFKELCPSDRYRHT